MPTDSSNRLPSAPKPDWRLPSVIDIKIRRVRFEPHKHKHFKSALARFKQAIEFRVKTSGPVPARALGPALFVGDTEVSESELVGGETTSLRFLSFFPKTLPPGAPISWGWMGATRRERQKTEFRYDLKE
jgi:hypothetical protein